MRFVQIILICLIIIVLSNTSSNELTEEQEQSLNACLKLKIQAPYLNLKCENIIENNNSELNKVKNLRKKGNIKQQFRTISFEDIKANTKKINATDEKRLRNLIRQLKN